MDILLILLLILLLYIVILIESLELFVFLLCVFIVFQGLRLLLFLLSLVAVILSLINDLSSSREENLPLPPLSAATTQEPSPPPSSTTTQESISSSTSTTTQESSSSPTPSSVTLPPQQKYDVFISFRGIDNRGDFTSHLHLALDKKNIKTFKDYQLRKGDKISSSLSKAIQESKISIIVFSKGYASSRWCLEELVQIMECKKMYGQNVIPVFYHVQPTDVRNQTGTFAEAFVEHEKHRKRLNKLKTWRDALEEASGLSGFNSDDIRPDSSLIVEIVEDVLKRLNRTSESDYSDLIGMESKIKIIESLFGLSSSKDVYTVGIWGLGGIGKTTIARAVFSKISSRFEASYFVHNVRERSEKSDGLIDMQLELLSTILDDKNLKKGSDLINLKFVKERLASKMALIVFDDVSDPSQIKSLIESFDLFGSGSHFIITTRDKWVLRNYGVKNIYDVEKLSDDEALQLFNRHAFTERNPGAGFIELSNTVVAKAKGVPLALIVLGSFLSGRETEVLQSALDKLEKTPHTDIQKVLQISYDGLDPDTKNIFLDIACFFNFKHKDQVMSFLKACGFHPEIGLNVLEEKSLITIKDNIITMHDLLQEMGRGVVQQESKDLIERSRLWDHADIHKVLAANKEMKTIEGISLDLSRLRETKLNLRALSKMHNMRFFNFYNSQDDYSCSTFEEFELTSIKLSYFCWFRCPLKSMPLTSHLNNLVRLEMPHSKIEQFWNDVQDLSNLKHVDLSYSILLTRCPDLSCAPNLEVLILKDCTGLVEIPSFTPLESLRTLNLSSCVKLKRLPKIQSFNMEELRLDGTKIVELSKLNFLESMEILSSISHGFFSNVMDLDLTDCGMMKLPHDLGLLSSLKRLHLGMNDFESLPASIQYLSQLEQLDLSVCERLHSLPKLPRNLIDINAGYCTSLEILSGLPSVFITTTEVCEFDFHNCWKLDGKAMIKDVILEIQHKGSAWFRELFYSKKARPHARIKIPGTGREIPGWFNFQCTSSNFITLKLPPKANGNGNFVCAVCIAFEFYCVRWSPLSPPIPYEIRTNGQCLHARGMLCRSTDHLTYDFFLLGYDNCSDEVSFIFDKATTKFGVHLIYDQDFEEPMKQLNTGLQFFNRVGSIFEK